jgi:putative acetyltransferase
VHPSLTIHIETGEDIPRIRAVVQAAFGRAGEADLVDALRRSGVLMFSTVAVIGGRIVAHAAFSPVTIDGQRSALALAPVAVEPDWQRRGIGSALVQSGLDECRRSGHGVVIVLGAPA